jgi:hypothetical protein
MGNPTITAWRTAGEHGDAAAAAACLAPEVEMISPLTAQFRFHGRAEVTDVLASAFEVIHEIRYHTEVGATDTWALFYHGMARRGAGRGSAVAAARRGRADSRDHLLRAAAAGADRG